MKRIIVSAWIGTMSFAALADGLTTREGLHVAANYGDSTLDGYDKSGKSGLSSFKLNSGVVSYDTEERVYYSGDYGFKMNSINTPDSAPFKLYSLDFVVGVGLAALDSALHQGETQWPVWIDDIGLTLGFGIPVFASEKVFHRFGSNVSTYSISYGLRYYISPSIDISFTTEKINGLLIGADATSATTNGMEIEYSF